MRGLSKSDIVSSISGVGSASNAKSVESKFLGFTGTISGLIGASRDARSVAKTARGPSAFSPPRLFHRPSKYHVFNHSQSLKPKQLPFSRFTTYAAVASVASVAYGVYDNYSSNKDKDAAQLAREMPLSDLLSLAAVATTGVPPISATFYAASAAYSNSDITVGDFIDAWEDLLNGDLEITPEDLGGFLEEALEDWSRWVYDQLPIPDSMNPWKNLPRSNQTRTYDPLALDLDGDGLETVGTNHFSGSLFDHNRDGIRTATGWVAADDGFLVYDRNGNGMIDHGGELFGDNTLLADGSRAAHGYAALAELDTDGNGKVDAADQAFSSLRVWRDLNQDGISQNGELFALADVGVQALNLAHTTPNTDLGNGNFLAQSGSYTRTDGTTAQMGDLDLAADLLFSRHSETVELTDGQRQAPNLQGMGRLRDLREAAALSGSLNKGRWNLISINSII